MSGAPPRTCTLRKVPNHRGAGAWPLPLQRVMNWGPVFRRSLSSSSPHQSSVSEQSGTCWSNESNLLLTGWTGLSQPPDFLVQAYYTTVMLAFFRGEEKTQQGKRCLLVAFLSLSRGSRTVGRKSKNENSEAMNRWQQQQLNAWINPYGLERLDNENNFFNISSSPKLIATNVLNYLRSLPWEGTSDFGFSRSGYFQRFEIKTCSQLLYGCNLEP